MSRLRWYTRVSVGGLLALGMAACGDAGDNGPTSTGPGQTATGGAYPGTGGAYPGTGGAYPGTGGAYAGTGGVYPGTGGVYPGTGGVVVGTGGEYPGTGGVVVGTGGVVVGTGGVVVGTGGVPGTGGVVVGTGGVPGTGGSAGLGPCGNVPITPGGYCVSGNQIFDAQGTPIIFRGVNKPGLEDKITGEHHACAEEFAVMRQWGSNIVRIPLNQTWWLQDEQGYKARVDDYINWTLSNGMVAIADVHRSATGTSVKDEGHADAETVQFWREFAQVYKDNSQLIFELYNEPRSIGDQDLWRGGNGVAGIQEMYNVIRNEVGAHQIILIGGNDWGYDLRGWNTYPLDAGHYNVAFSAHPYSFNGKDTEAEWLTDWAFLRDSYPYILTEFGHAPNDPDNYAYERMLLDFCETHGLGWTAWAWTDYFNNHSMFDKDYNPPNSWGTITTHGALIQEYLAP